MKSILIDSLFTTSAPSPSNARSDGASPAHTLWESGDEAGFSLTVPPDYSAGTDLSLVLEESSPSVGLCRSWSVKCSLKKENDGRVSTSEESSEHPFTASNSADTVTERSMTVTGSLNPGTVDNIAIQPGDYLTFIVRRSACETDEDPDAVKVFNISVEYEAAQALLSNCPGRIGLIMETSRDLFNEPEADFLTDDFMLRSINRCLQDLSMEGYWRRSSWIPATPGHDMINLLGAIPDYNDVYQISYGPQRWPMTNVSSIKRMIRLKMVFDSPGTPEYYLIQNNNLLITPAPSVSLSKGFLVHHSYCPSPLTCSDKNPNPDIPKSYDQLFVYFTLCQAFLKDRGAPGADTKFHEYTTLYQSLKNRLMATAAPVRASIRPST